jgi:hypothetical protein
MTCAYIDRLASRPTIRIVNLPPDTKRSTIASLYRKLYGRILPIVPSIVTIQQEHKIDTTDIYVAIKNQLQRLYRYVRRHALPPKEEAPSTSPSTSVTSFEIPGGLLNLTPRPSLFPPIENDDLLAYQPSCAYAPASCEENDKMWYMLSQGNVNAMTREYIADKLPVQRLAISTIDFHAIIRFHAPEPRIAVLTRDELIAYQTRPDMYPGIVIDHVVRIIGAPISEHLLDIFDTSRIEHDDYFLELTYKIRKLALVLKKPAKGSVIRPIMNHLFKTYKYSSPAAAAAATVPVTFADVYIECMDNIVDFKVTESDFMPILTYLGYTVDPTGYVQNITKNTKCM